MTILGLIMLNACEHSTDAPESSPDYYQLAPGNYWVYEVQQIWNDTSIEVLPETDSIYIEKDTLINNVKYSKIVGDDWLNITYNYFLRDSIGYLVDYKGKVHFSEVNFTDTLYAHTDHFVRIAYKMDANDSLISVPLGSFNCRFYRGTITLLYPSMNNLTKTQGEFRADGIGLITSNIVSAGEPDFRIKKNLLRYHLANTN